MSRFGIGEGINATLLTPAQGAGFSLSDYAKGGVNDLVNRVFCNNDLPDAGGELSDKMAEVTTKLLDYTANSEPQSRCFFRLGEALAKAVGKISDKKWPYAGFRNNSPTNIEGASFRASDGSDKEAIGLNERADGSFLDNNPCEVLRLVSAAIDETDSLIDILEKLATPDIRRKYFRQYLAQNLGGTTWEVGMEFLPKSNTPIGGSDNGNGGGNTTVPPAPSSGSGGIIAIAAAAAAAYFLTKG